ncbi:hypothetical protein KZY93_002235 [Vibrio vulnificus]|uniref:hypothetical protein n=1 Tax=Vibrio vulnificus TaxID=672 RepID=UPI0010EF5FBB|nr:hypothetical protein [Vibrio vulnificus]EHU9518851.1 hypothetical protein [Vibrio vulnificus]RZP69954.1 hypothetical protein D8T53_06515 [Vibrio vulnificus]
MHDHIVNLVERNRFILFLKQNGVNISKVINDILEDLDEDELHRFSNQHHRMLSPNVYVEALVFKHVNRLLYANNCDPVKFSGNGRIDIKTMLAASMSQITRPDIAMPSSLSSGFKEHYVEDGFVVLSRFERQFIPDDYTEKTEKNMFISFEGFLPDYFDANPLIEDPFTEDIWTNSYCLGEPIIQGFCTNFHSVNAQHVLWVNSKILEILNLKLDCYNNGLRAVGDQGDVVLEYRHWRGKLIGYGPYFVGMNANIPKIEGCDLILREDYFTKLKLIIPNLFFYTYVM